MRRSLDASPIHLIDRTFSQVMTSMSRGTRTTLVAVLLAALAASGCTDSLPLAPDGRRYPVYPSFAYLQTYGGSLELSVHEAPGDYPVYSAVWLRSSTTGWPNWYWDGVREPRIVLALRTSSLWSAGGRLETEVQVDGDSINVRVMRVFPTRLATIGGPSPAFSSQFLPLSSGEYRLTIDVLGMAQVFRLRITDSAIELTQISEPVAPNVFGLGVVKPDQTTVLRFPTRSFALYCWSPEQDICSEIDDRLAGEPGFARHHFPALGQIPFRTLPDHEAPDHTVGYFRYSDDRDFARLRDVMCALAPREQRLALQVESWRNEGIYVEKGTVWVDSDERGTACDS
jgi:hypothetical protein